MYIFWLSKNIYDEAENIEKLYMRNVYIYLYISIYKKKQILETLIKFLMFRSLCRVADDVTCLTLLLRVMNYNKACVAI